MGIHIPCTNNKADTRMVIRLTKSVITFGNLDFVVPKPLLTAVALDSEIRENFGLRISSPSDGSRSTQARRHRAATASMKYEM